MASDWLIQNIFAGDPPIDQSPCRTPVASRHFLCTQFLQGWPHPWKEVTEQIWVRSEFDALKEAFTSCAPAVFRPLGNPSHKRRSRFFYFWAARLIFGSRELSFFLPFFFSFFFLPLLLAHIQSSPPIFSVSVGWPRKWERNGCKDQSGEVRPGIRLPFFRSEISALERREERRRRRQERKKERKAGSGNATAV